MVVAGLTSSFLKFPFLNVLSQLTLNGVIFMK